ncbi:MAG: CRISPR system precrRNA processing endoribonuclease RAMP protein Cas6 [Methanosarcinales archaeon]
MPKLNSTIIKIDIKTKKELKKDFLGAVFRGWLGYVLKCNPKEDCKDCFDTFCPYFMVFKEKNDVKPFSLACFKDKEIIRGYIKLYGDRMDFASEIWSLIKEKEEYTHFGGMDYRIESIKAEKLKIPNYKLQDSTLINFVTPVCLMRNRRVEVIPSFNTILKSSIRAFNRITKYYDKENYPYTVPDEVFNAKATIQDFNVKTFKYKHTNLYNKKIILEGIIGWIKYDTKDLPEETGQVLKIGSKLQIGKHTAYGFGLIRG